MDPNANLEEQLALAEQLLSEDANAFTDTDDLQETARRLAELVQALDTWITSGGFLPKPWSKP